MEEALTPPRGTRDIVGREAKLYYRLFRAFAEIAERHGFEPIITPTIEHYRLFEEKSGEEIKKSMYVFQDKAGRLIALRPEVTASVIRAYLREMRGRPKPLRLFYIAQCFRYEEPQRARYREFWQGGLEIIGDESPNADVAVAYAASKFLDKLGLEHEYIVGNVLTYRAIMSAIGISPADQDHILHLIDKGEIDALDRELRERNWNNLREILWKIMSSGIDKASGLIEEFRGVLGDRYSRVVAEQERLETFKKSLEDLGYTVKYEPKLVRGLAYYTGLIWEYKTRGLEQSIGGGGRYDGLTSVYAKVYEPSTGLALGIDRVALALEGREKPLLGKELTVMVAVLSGDVPLSYAHKIAESLREVSVTFVMLSQSLSKALSYANKEGVDVVVIVGPREYKTGVVTVRDMTSRIQSEIPVDELVEHVKSLSASR